jgi:transposase
VCLDARHARAALKMQINKTDQNDAEGLAQIMRTGWYRPVHVKSFEAHRARSLLGARSQLVGMTTRLSGAHLGLTPRRYQSGEIGRISRCGDDLARTLMYEAAVIILTRVKREMQAIATEAVGPRCSNASPLWTLQ